MGRGATWLPGALGLLAGMQALRWAIESLAFALLGRTPLGDAAVRTFVYLLLLAALAFAARCRDVHVRLLPGRWGYGWTLVCIACGALVVATPFLTGQAGDPVVWAELVCLVVATPLFEETLFRGYLWEQLGRSGDGRAPSLEADSVPDNPVPGRSFPWREVVMSALLFGLWHLGYADVVAWQLSAEGLVGSGLIAACVGALAGKVVLGVFVGLAFGAARARWGCVLPALLLHVAWNVLA